MPNIQTQIQLHGVLASFSTQPVPVNTTMESEASQVRYFSYIHSHPLQLN